ncbi:hypothetical protein SELMODRAFT_409622 [Selaginella moellendorffii]|uniref:Uncharacterized protein n=1 Tax=Selaginella moellendorffii TaxID=88036 RepID=D8RDH4_SELML|nr:hypothetical protein SELMODRAFT_409622 [Selaginella moellendorffii]
MQGFSSSSPASFEKTCHRALLQRATQLYIQASRTSPGNTSWIPTNPTVALMAEILSSLTSYGPGAYRQALSVLKGFSSSSPASFGKMCHRGSQVLLQLPLEKCGTQGDATTCYAALHPSLKDVTGQYFVDSNKSNCSTSSYGPSPRSL